MDNTNVQQNRDRLILENARHYAIITTNMDGIIDSWSLGAETLFGWHEGEMLGQSIDIVFTKEDRQSGLPANRRQMAHIHRLDRVERWHQRKDGTKFWASGDLQLIFDDQNAPIGFLKIVRDRTEERQHAEAMRLSEERVRLAQEAGGIGAFAIDKTRHMILTTAKFNELLGLPPSKEVPFSKLVDAITESGDQLADKMYNPQDGELIHLEIPVRRSDNGDIRWIAYWAENAPVDADSVNANHILGVIQDITRRRTAQEKKDILAHELAHRVKNILAIVHSIANQSFYHASNMKEAHHALSARLRALADAQDILMQGTSHSVDLGEIVACSLNLHAGVSRRFICSGPPTALNSQAALSMSLAMHELGTNAIKYGAFSNGTGIVEVSWKFADRQFHFRWQEKNGPLVEEPTHKGFGSKLIERLLPESLNGQASLDYAKTGFIYYLEAPISEFIHPQPSTATV